MGATASSGVGIRLVRCAKTFQDTRVLEPLDLQIEPGETLVLLGPSGCGKTTTLRIIAGLEAPDAGGQVWFGEDDVTRLPIERRHVGMVFQSYALFPNMSVRENVEYGLRVRRVDAAERRRRVDAMLEMTEITELQHRSIDQLSGGQRQRVALARAIAPQPRVLLLDEPLTALDARLRENLRTEIDRLLRRLGVTAVYVTHDQAEAMALGDRIAVMDQGRMAQIGTPQAIYFEPANDFVASFIGTLNVVADAFGAGRTVAFRPEDVSLVPAQDATAAAPERAVGPLGRVSASFFLGDHARVVVELPPPTTPGLRAPGLGHDAAGQAVQRVTARVAPRLAPRVGDAVRLVVAAGALRDLSKDLP
jgi:putative spermidine/putrescine transport system ATP-binding protein